MKMQPLAGVFFKGVLMVSFFRHVGPPLTVSVLGRDQQQIPGGMEW